MDPAHLTTAQTANRLSSPQTSASSAQCTALPEGHGCSRRLLQHHERGKTPGQLCFTFNIGFEWSCSEGASMSSHSERIPSGHLFTCLRYAAQSGPGSSRASTAKTPGKPAASGDRAVATLAVAIPGQGTILYSSGSALQCRASHSLCPAHLSLCLSSAGSPVVALPLWPSRWLSRPHSPCTGRRSR